MIICEVCQHEIAQGQSVVHKVLGWVVVKNNKQTGNVLRPSQPLGYAHRICLDTSEVSRQQDTLF
jgi:hypothetical protein